jgi:hypothetical protein
MSIEKRGMPMRRHDMYRSLIGCGLLALASCGAPSGNQVQETNAAGGNAASGNDMTAVGPSSAPVSNGMAAAEPATANDAAAAGPLSCAADIGAAAAQKRVALCRSVSPATRPPCNVANSCAMIEDEIARSCALIDRDRNNPPTPGCSPAPHSIDAAAAVVARYYSAINARDFGTAWSQWGEHGRPGQTLAQFEAGFAQTRSTRATIGRLTPGDAGAGSLYQPVPVTVDSQLSDGRRQRFVGEYIVRRVNDVDGASPAQLRWHIDSARLKAAPVD